MWKNLFFESDSLDSFDLFSDSAHFSSSSFSRSFRFIFRLILNALDDLVESPIFSKSLNWSLFDMWRKSSSSITAFSILNLMLDFFCNQINWPEKQNRAFDATQIRCLRIFKCRYVAFKMQLVFVSVSQQICKWQRDQTNRLVFQRKSKNDAILDF